MINEIKTFETRKEELVKKGKETGKITFEQLAQTLKGLDLDAESLDDLYNTFSENNIVVVSENEDDESSGTDKIDKLLLDDNTLTKDLTINDYISIITCGAYVDFLDDKIYECIVGNLLNGECRFTEKLNESYYGYEGKSGFSGIDFIKNRLIDP